MPTKSFDDYLDKRSKERTTDGAEVFAAAAAHFIAVEAGIGVGHQLAAIREAAGLTQAELAARAGIAQADISRIERDQGNPTEKTLRKVGEPLGIQLAWAPRTTRS